MAHRILVVEDEIDLVQVIRYQLVKMASMSMWRHGAQMR